MKIRQKIRELTGPQGKIGLSNQMPDPDQPRPEYRNPVSPLMGSVPRPAIPSGTAAAPFEFPNDSSARMPILHQQPQATASADTAYPVDPRVHTELPSGHVIPSTIGPDPRPATMGKVFGTPTLHTLPPMGGRLQLTPRKQIPDK